MKEKTEFTPEQVIDNFTDMQRRVLWIQETGKVINKTLSHFRFSSMANSEEIDEELITEVLLLAHKFTKKYNVPDGSQKPTNGEDEDDK